MFPTPEIQKEKLKAVLKYRWDVEADFWIPLDEISTTEEVVYFPQDFFITDFGLENLRSIVNKISRGQLFMWQWEVHPEEFYSIDLEGLAKYNLLEKYYFDETCDWIIYLSHENTIAIGGQKFIEKIIEKWPNWIMCLNSWYVNDSI